MPMRSLEQVAYRAPDFTIDLDPVPVHHLVDHPTVLLRLTHDLLDLVAEVTHEGVGRPIPAITEFRVFSAALVQPADEGADVVARSEDMASTSITCSPTG